MQLFTLSSLLQVAVLVLVIIWIFRKQISGELQGIASIVLNFILLLIGGLIVVSLFTIKNYFLPSLLIYKNTDYHALELSGHTFKDSIHLVNSISPTLNRQSLWDDKVGKVSIRQVDPSDSTLLLNIEGLNEPFYVLEQNINAPEELHRKIYSLANPVFPIPFTESNSLKIQFCQDTSCYAVEITYKNFDKDSTQYFVQTTGMNRPQKSDFTTYLVQGFSVAEIILQTDSLARNPAFDQLINYIDGSFLLRDKLLKSTYRPAYKKLNANMLFFPGSRLFGSKNKRVKISIGNVDLELDNLDQVYSYKMKPEIGFFLGLGYAKTNSLKLNIADEIETSTPVFSMDYDEPLRFSLARDIEPKDSLIDHTITSSNSVVSENDFSGGYLYEFFHQDDHDFDITARLRYYIGSASDSMFFNILDYNILQSEGNLTTQDETILSGQAFELYSNAANKFTWKFQIRDFREESPVKPYTFYLFIIIFCIYLLYRFYYVNQGQNYFTAIELSLYVVFYVFVIAKLVLLWRMYAFPPMDKEIFFYEITKKSHYLWTMIPVYVFLMIAFLYFFWKKNSNNINIPGWEKYIQSESRHSNYLLAHFLLFLICLLTSILISPRFFNIAMPLALYLIGNWWIKDVDTELLKKFGSKSLHQEQKDLFVFLRDIWNHAWYYKFSYVLIGLLSITLLFFVNFEENFFQSGKNWIIITTFTLFITGLLTQITRIAQVKELFSGWFRNSYNLGISLKAGIDILSLSFLIVLDTGFGIIFLMYYFLHQIIGGILLQQGWFSGTTSAGMHIRRKPYLKWIVPLLLMLVFFVLIRNQNTIIEKSLSTSEKYLPWAKGKSYIKYRAAIQDPKNSVSELIINENFQSLEVRQILNASHNQWFINNYINGDNKPFGTEKYFNLRPHFDQGASYTTQTTDLVISRYLIGEHGESCVLALIAMFIMLIAIYKGTYYNGVSDDLSSHFFSFLSILILLFCSAFFVWLTTTNRFTFFGQDFPFLSLTSKFSTILFIFFFSVLLINNPKDKLYFLDRNYANHYFTFLLVVLFGAVFQFIKPSNTIEAKGDTHYNVNRLIDYTNKTIREIDDMFLDYQEDREYALHTGSNARPPLSELLTYFTNDKKLFLPSINTGGKKAINERDEFINSAWDYFVNKQPNKRDPDELIHIRERNEVYRFALNRNYYFIAGSQEIDEYTKRDIYAAKVDLKYGLVDLRDDSYFKVDNEGPDNVIENYLNTITRKSLNNVEVVFLGKHLTEEGQPKFLIARDQIGVGQYSIYADNFSIDEENKPEINQVFSLNEGDYLFIYEQEALRKKFQLNKEADKFLSKHIWLNGRPKYHYPLAEKFLWSYHFTNLADRYAKEKITRDEKSSEVDSQVNLDNLRLSIDYDLTNNIYENIRKYDDPLPDRVVALFSSFLDRLPFRDRIQNEQMRVYISLEGNNVRLAANSGEDIELNNALRKINLRLEANKLLKRSSTTTEQIYRIVGNEVREAIRGNVDFSITAIDGNGRVRLLLDYKRERPVNPNNINEARAFLRRIYTESTVRLEQDIFGNKNLIQFNPGPGSSIKPLIYSSVISQSNFDWENLRLKNLNDLSQQRGYDRLTRGDTLGYYGGKKIENGWKLYSNFFRGLSPKEYLVNSNNLYHSVVIFMGSYPSNREPINLLNASQKTSLIDKYPILITGSGQEKIFDANNWPKREGALEPFGNPKSALADGLITNYNIPILEADMYMDVNSANKERIIFKRYATDTITFRTKSESDLFTFGDTVASGNNFWGLPEQSHFIQKKREWTERNGLIQPSLGARPIAFTPLKAAEMALRMATLNKNVKITFIDSVSSPSSYMPFTGVNESRIKYLHQNIIFPAMRDVPRIGTASELRTFSEKLRQQGLYMYAKTGTIDDIEDDRRRGKHLLVILSNQQLERITDPSILKLYTILIAFHSIPYEVSSIPRFKNWNIATGYIQAIIESNTFQKYMND